MAKKYQLTQLGVEVQALLDKMETLEANRVPAQGQETAPLETLSLNGVVYTIDTKAAEVESYQNLAELRRTGKLVPGKSYRITDYVATTLQEDTRSANHPFDIVVMAISETNLSEDAKAVLHEGDTYFSQAGAKLDSWIVRYCFDNDVTRFPWADAENGRGVVYRLVDEWGNDLPYDFKGVQFKRYNVASVEAKYQDALSPLIGLPIAHKWSKGLVRDNANFKWYYTFSMLGQTWDDEVTDGSLNGESTNGNVIKASLFYRPLLCDLVCANGPVLHDFLLSFLPGSSSVSDPRYISANNEYDGESMVHNSFFGTNANVFTASQFRRNTVVGPHRHAVYETDCQDNTIFAPRDNAMCHFGHFFANNVIRAKSISSVNAHDDFQRNFINLAGQFGYGFFGNNFQDNTIIGERLGASSIGTYFARNTMREINLDYCQIDGQITDCEFVGRVGYCSIRGVMSFLVIPATASSWFADNEVVGNIRGTTDAKISLDAPAFFIDAVSGIKRLIKIEGDTDGNVVATWKDGGHTIGVMKAPGSSEWVDIPADYTIYEALTNKVQTIVGNESDQTKYPTTKAVSDFVASKDKVFIAEFDVTPYADVLAAVNDNSKAVFCQFLGKMIPYISKDDDGTIRFGLVVEKQDQSVGVAEYVSYIFWVDTGFGWNFAVGHRKPFLDTTSETALPTKALESLMATVKLHKISKTGSYNDLLDKPTIPADKVYIAEWNVTPYADVLAAVNDNGKVVFCQAFGSMIPFTSKDSDGTMHFTLWEEEQDQYGDATNYLSYTIMLRNPATVTGNGWSFAIGNRQPFIDTTSEMALTPQQDENIMKKISLHKVSKTGNYNDLLNKPSIPVLESMTASEVTAAVNTAWDNVMNA